MERIIHYCVPCSFVEKVVKATMFCVICVDYLCETCSKIHSKSKATRSHKILSGDEVPINTDAFSALANVLSCKHHPNIDVQFECLDHHEFICGLCLRNSHRQCEHVEEIEASPDLNKGIEKCIVIRQRAKDLGKKLNSAKLGHDQNVKKCIHEENSLSKERPRLIEKIKSVLVMLDTQCSNDTQLYIERHSIHSCNTIEREHVSYCELLELSLKYADCKQLKVVTSLANHNERLMQNEIDTLESKSQQLQPLVMKHKLLREITSTVDLLGVSQQQISTNNDIECGNDEIIENESNKNEKDSVIVEDNKTAIIPENEICAKNASKQKSYVPLLERTIKKIEDHTVNGKLIDAVLLPDGRYICLCIMSITVYSKSFEIITQFGLVGTPAAVCLLENASIAVAYASKKVVDIFKIHVNIVERVNGFSIPLYCHSLTKYVDDIAMVCADKDHGCAVNAKHDAVEIQIRNKDGSLSKVINKFTDPYGMTINLVDPKCIISMKKNELFLGDKTQLRCFGVNGQSKWFLKSHKGYSVQGLTGLAIDNENNLYACGYDSNNLLQICLSDYRKHRVLIPNIARPLCVAYDSKHQRLIVGCYNNTVKVYTLV